MGNVGALMIRIGFWGAPYYIVIVEYTPNPILTLPIVLELVRTAKKAFGRESGMGIAASRVASKRSRPGNQRLTAYP